MKIFIHLGVHKTATTLLQKSLQLNRNVLLKNGVGIIVRDSNKIIKNQLRLFVKKKSSISEAQSRIKKFLDTAKNKGVNKIIISDENLLDAPPSVYFKRNGELRFYPKAKTNIEKLKSLFDGLDITWLIYSREQHSLIPSLYKDGLKYFRYSCTLFEFYDNINFEKFRFDRLIASLNEVVKNDRILVKNYESIINNVERFILDFYQVFTQISDIRMPNKKINASMSLFQGALFKLFASKSLNKLEKQKIKQWIHEAPKIDSFLGKSDLILTEGQKEVLIQKFKDDISYKR